MNSLEWVAHGLKYEWYPRDLPPRWKRLPIIRHVRCMIERIKVEAWYSYGPGAIGLRTGYDDWILYGIWRGWQ